MFLDALALYDRRRHLFAADAHVDSRDRHGRFFIPPVSITLSGLPGPDPAASGLSNFVRIMCGGIGTSIFQTAWDHRTIKDDARLADQATRITRCSSIDAAVRRGGLSQQQAYGLFNTMATQQAAQLGVNDLFFFSAGIFVALIALIWVTRPERAGGDAGAAAAAAH